MNLVNGGHAGIIHIGRLLHDAVILPFFSSAPALAANSGGGRDFQSMKSLLYIYIQVQEVKISDPV